MGKREEERERERKREEKRVWEGNLYRERTKMSGCRVVVGGHDGALSVLSERRNTHLQTFGEGAKLFAARRFNT